MVGHGLSVRPTCLRSAFLWRPSWSIDREALDALQNPELQTISTGSVFLIWITVSLRLGVSSDVDNDIIKSTFPGTPINRLPIMAKQVLDMYELYNLVVARGGLVEVINKKLWQEIIKGLKLPSSITSAAFTLRTQ